MIFFPIYFMLQPW